MSAHRSWLLAGALLALGVGLSVAAGILTYADDGGGLAFYGFLFAVLIGPFLIMGGLLIAHLPRHLVGWLLMLVGLNQAFNLFCDGYSDYQERSLPLADVLYAIGEVNWAISMIIICTLLPLLFPTGRPPSPRWRWFGYLALASIALISVAGPIVVWYERHDLLTGEATRSAPPVAEVAITVFVFMLIPAIFGSVASVWARFRRARGIEREQLKWFVCAALICTVLAAYVVGPEIPAPGWLILVPVIGFVTLPLAIGVAILRYRLYDIDRLINRALVYVSLTALLVGVYALLVVALQRVFDSLTSGSDLAVAGSTLAVAALFRPARSRIQGAVDRRFYRRKYDAARTVEAFAARLRNEIDLDALTGELRVVVQETVQPAHVSLWLRPPRPQA